MATRRTPLIAISVLAAAAGGYGLYLTTAQTAPPELSQSPMNITNVIPPAFIMAVDNSGSMSSDETLFRTATGPGYYNNGSFFDGAGKPNESGGTTISKHMDGGYNQDYYAALRSPEHNRAYFDPATTYLPWRTSTGVDEANSPTNAAKEDPRATSPAATP
ncbi:hypothetical protein H1235_05205 [Pseudoxanthomonas sp. NC8]|nr:hypothetical protein H1235_05205 [Pseudoxanthomonas sp. NC8]